MVNNEQQIEEISPSKRRIRRIKKTRAFIILLVIAVFLLMSLYSGYRIKNYYDGLEEDLSLNEYLVEVKETTVSSAHNTEAVAETNVSESSVESHYSFDPTIYPNYIPGMLDDYVALHGINQDMIGWLYIPDTRINMPVMQTMDNEEFYLRRNFNKDYSSSGCLLLDTSCRAGIGDVGNDYCLNGESEVPSTNLIIHGHNMRNGMMFGGLSKYADRAYCREHDIIYFDTLYERRSYRVISVFYGEVLEKTSEEFKFYQFFDAASEEEFDYYYNNIKALSLYDTGVTATYGDEFITLSCCSKHTENGRFVVIAKRIYE